MDKLFNEIAALEYGELHDLFVRVEALYRERRAQKVAQLQADASLLGVKVRSPRSSRRRKAGASDAS